MITNQPEPDYTGRVKLQTLMAVLLAGTISSGTVAHSADVIAEHTTLCNIVNHPSDFIGKTIEIRAHIWPDSNNKVFWMNESSGQLNTVCPFLEAAFTQKTDLYGQTAFGTFRGRIVRKQSRQVLTSFGPEPKGPRIMLLVDEASDIYLRRDYLNGPIPKLQLYDKKTATFLRPED
ncbi:MAG: hypothetical protein WA815_18575 [Terracidiphilus sp.]